MRAVWEKYRNLPLISGFLVLINVIIYIICSFTGNLLYEIGGLSVQEVVWNREYGRVLWSMFLHSDLNHLFNNMLILFFLGAMIEKEVGHIPYALFYFLSGVGGNLLSLLYKLVASDWMTSIGASGAVFGLDGVMLALVLFSGRKMPSVTPIRVILMVLFSLYSGFTGDNIDNAAHIGGLLTGFLLAIVLCTIRRRKEARLKSKGEWQ